MENNRPKNSNPENTLNRRSFLKKLGILGVGAALTTPTASAIEKAVNALSPTNISDDVKSVLEKDDFQKYMEIIEKEAQKERETGEITDLNKNTAIGVVSLFGGFVGNTLLADTINKKFGTSEKKITDGEFNAKSALAMNAAAWGRFGALKFSQNPKDHEALHEEIHHYGADLPPIPLLAGIADVTEHVESDIESLFDKVNKEFFPEGLRGEYLSPKRPKFPLTEKPEQSLKKWEKYLERTTGDLRKKTNQLNIVGGVLNPIGTGFLASDIVNKEKELIHLMTYEQSVAKAVLELNKNKELKNNPELFKNTVVQKASERTKKLMQSDWGYEKLALTLSANTQGVWSPAMVAGDFPQLFANLQEFIPQWETKEGVKAPTFIEKFMIDNAVGATLSALFSIGATSYWLKKADALSLQKEDFFSEPLDEMIAFTTSLLKTITNIATLGKTRKKQLTKKQIIKLVQNETLGSEEILRFLNQIPDNYFQFGIVNYLRQKLEILKGIRGNKKIQSDITEIVEKTFSDKDVLKEQIASRGALLGDSFTNIFSISKEIAEKEREQIALAHRNNDESELELSKEQKNLIGKRIQEAQKVNDLVHSSDDFPNMRKSEKKKFNTSITNAGLDHFLSQKKIKSEEVEKTAHLLSHSAQETGYALLSQLPAVGPIKTLMTHYLTPSKSVDFEKHTKKLALFINTLVNKNESETGQKKLEEEMETMITEINGSISPLDRKNIHTFIQNSQGKTPEKIGEELTNFIFEASGNMSTEKLKNLLITICLTDAGMSSVADNVAAFLAKKGIAMTFFKKTFGEDVFEKYPYARLEIVIAILKIAEMAGSLYQPANGPNFKHTRTKLTSLDASNTGKHVISREPLPKQETFYSGNKFSILINGLTVGAGAAYLRHVADRIEKKELGA